MDRIRHCTFRQLRIFETIARLGSFTAAADALHLTQPTVSMQIRKLTTAVGRPLFEQIGRKIYLTDAGKTLLKTVYEIFDAAKRFDLALENHETLKTGSLHISGVTTAEYFAPEILGHFRRKYPGITVSLNVSNRATVLERLLTNQDDLYFLSQLPEDIPVETTPFLDDELIVLAPPDHPLTKKRRIPLEQIVREQFITREVGAGTRMAIDSELQKIGISLVPNFELGSNEAIKHGIMGGLGIGILSRLTAQRETCSGQLVELDIEGFPMPHQWYVVYPQGKQLSVVARAFLTFIDESGYVQEKLRDMTSSPSVAD